MTRNALLFVIVAVVAWAGHGQPSSDAEALFPLRYELPNLERLIGIFELLLSDEPGNPSHLARLAQLWYERAMLVPSDQTEPTLRQAADYGFRALGVSGLDDGLRLSDGELGAILARTTDPAAILWTAHSWGLLLGRMNPLAAFFAIGKIRRMYERVIELDPGYMGGSALQALGALLANLSDYGILFGARLADAKAHFERAIALDPTYLENHVAFAREYAVRANDRVLFERLLRHVLDAPIGDWPFWNRYAKSRAAELLAQMERHFR